jgi:hypothetical protein
VTANCDLAVRARQLAAKAPPGSLDRKAALCAAVGLAESSTIDGARRVLDAWPGPAEIKTAAGELLGELLDDDQAAALAVSALARKGNT